MRRGSPTRAAGAEGLTLLELLVAVSLGTLLILAVTRVGTAVAGFFDAMEVTSEPLSESAGVYWTVERLAQNTLRLGTQNLTQDTFEPGATAGPVPVLAMYVSSLDGIVPPTAPVYAAATHGGTDYVCLAVVPVDGVDQLALFPGGDPYDPAASPPVYPPAADVTPIGTGSVDEAGTTFTVLAPASGQSAPVSFDLNLRTRIVGGGYPRPSFQTTTYPFEMGPEDY